MRLVSVFPRRRFRRFHVERFPDVIQQTAQRHAVRVLSVISLSIFACLYLALPPALAQAPDTAEAVHATFCASEGMLAWQGDPPLRGAVRLLSIAQYEARRSADGQLIKQSEQPSYYAEFTLSPQGELLQDVRRHTGRPEDTQITKYDIHSVTLYDAGTMTAAFRYVPEYDVRGRLVAEHLYKGDERIRTETIYTYDAMDRLESSRNSLGQLVVYSYDEAGRLVREDWSAAATPERPFSSHLTTYDSRGRIIAYCESNISEAFPERNTTFEKRWVYDDWGNLVRVQRFILSPRIELLGEEVYEYNPDGRIVRSSLTGETGSVTNRYIYNANGAITEINRTVRELSGWRFNERIHFTLDENGNWLRAAMESEKRACIIERSIEYY